VSRVKTNLDTVLSIAQVSARCFDVKEEKDFGTETIRWNGVC
jgi:hypothetical protein